MELLRRRVYLLKQGNDHYGRHNDRYIDSDESGKVICMVNDNNGDHDGEFIHHAR